MSTTRLICSECGNGNYRNNGRGMGVCTQCENTVSIAPDVEPYADDATISTDAEGYLTATITDA